MCSEFLQLSHLLELRAVTAVHLASTRAHDTLTAAEWQKAFVYVSVLKAVNEATSSASSVTYSRCQKLSLLCTVCILYLKQNWLVETKYHLWKELGTTLKDKVPQLRDSSFLCSSYCTWPEVQRYLFLNRNGKEEHQDAEMYNCCERFFQPFRICKISYLPRECRRRVEVSHVGHLSATSSTHKEKCISYRDADKCPDMSILGATLLLQWQNPLSWQGTKGKKGNKHLSLQEQHAATPPHQPCRVTANQFSLPAAALSQTAVVTSCLNIPNS